MLKQNILFQVKRNLREKRVIPQWHLSSKRLNCHCEVSNSAQLWTDESCLSAEDEMLIDNASAGEIHQDHIHLAHVSHINAWKRAWTSAAMKTQILLVQLIQVKKKNTNPVITKKCSCRGRTDISLSLLFIWPLKISQIKSLIIYESQLWCREKREEMLPHVMEVQQ